MLTLTQVEQMVADAGFDVSRPRSFECEATIYACSIQGTPGTFGHPRYEVMLDKESGVLSVTGQPAAKIYGQAGRVTDITRDEYRQLYPKAVESFRKAIA